MHAEGESFEEAGASAGTELSDNIRTLRSGTQHSRVPVDTNLFACTNPTPTSMTANPSNGTGGNKPSRTPSPPPVAGPSSAS